MSKCELVAYTGDRLGHFAHDGDMPSVDFRLAHLLGISVEPKIVRTVASQVVLVTTQVQIPHLIYYYFLLVYNYNY